MAGLLIVVNAVVFIGAGILGALVFSSAPTSVQEIGGLLFMIVSAIALMTLTISAIMYEDVINRIKMINSNVSSMEQRSNGESK